MSEPESIFSGITFKDEPVDFDTYREHYPEYVNRCSTSGSKRINLKQAAMDKYFELLHQTDDPQMIEALTNLLHELRN